MQKADYSRLKYNPFAVPKGALIGEHYAQLSRRTFFISVPEQIFKDRPQEGIEEIPTKKDLSLLVSFVILLCDPNSPFCEERDFVERKAMCMEALGIGRDTLVGKVIIVEHWWFGGVLSAYLRLLNTPLFDTWISLKINAEQTKAFLRRPLQDIASNGKASPGIEAMDLRRKIANDLKKMDAELLEVERMLFPDAQTKELVNEDATSESLAGYAEKYAVEYPI